LSKKLLVTGGDGVVGTILKQGLKEKYEITCLDLRKTGDECVTGDVANLDEIQNYFGGMDAVVHLAGVGKLEASWDSVYRSDIQGTHNVFEAARLKGVKKIVFASSNHVTGLYEKDWPISEIVKGEYKGLDNSKIPKISYLSPARADTFYGSGKLLGEGLAQYYSSEYGLSIICLRIGTVRPYEWPLKDEKRFFATWLSHPDLVQLVEKSLEAKNVLYDVFYGVSNNAWRFWDIDHSREVIGYSPVDNAEKHRT
jgi:nucleoside-diphosphate-sugar epimerase